MLIKKFTASWCESCKLVSMSLAQALHHYPDVIVEEIDLDNDHKLFKKLDVQSVPTLIKFRDGIEINRAIGALNVENLKRWLNN